MSDTVHQAPPCCYKILGKHLGTRLLLPVMNIIEIHNKYTHTFTQSWAVHQQGMGQKHHNAWGYLQHNKCQQTSTRQSSATSWRVEHDRKGDTSSLVFCHGHMLIIKPVIVCQRVMWNLSMRMHVPSQKEGVYKKWKWPLILNLSMCIQLPTRDAKRLYLQSEHSPWKGFQWHSGTWMWMPSWQCPHSKL